MEEIMIYLDKEKKNLLQDEIEFEEVVAGKISSRTIYLFNTIEYPVNVELELQGENIKILKSINQIGSKQTEEVVFELKPTITLMKPITAQLKIKINYLVR